MQSMQVKVAARQRPRCGSSFFLVRISPHSYFEVVRERLIIRNGEWRLLGRRAGVVGALREYIGGMVGRKGKGETRWWARGQQTGIGTSQLGGCLGVCRE